MAARFSYVSSSPRPQKRRCYRLRMRGACTLRQASQTYLSPDSIPKKCFRISWPDPLLKLYTYFYCFWICYPDGCSRLGPECYIRNDIPSMLLIHSMLSMKIRIPGRSNMCWMGSKTQETERICEVSLAR